MDSCHEKKKNLGWKHWSQSSFPKRKSVLWTYAKISTLIQFWKSCFFLHFILNKSFKKWAELFFLFWDFIGTQYSVFKKNKNLTCFNAWLPFPKEEADWTFTSLFLLKPSKATSKISWADNLFGWLVQEWKFVPSTWTTSL